MIRVFIADDHPIARRGLKQILSEQSDMVFVGEAGSGDEAIAAAKAGGIDVLVMEVSMPGKNGITAAGEIHRVCPDLKVLILTGQDDETFAVRAIMAGATGYVTKAAGCEDLATAIRTVARGDAYITASILVQPESGRGQPRALAPADRLSVREHEVMRLLAAGNSVRHIAEHLDRSIKTIHTHRYRIFEKLGVSSNSELTRYAIKAGIVD